MGQVFSPTTSVLSRYMSKIRPKMWSLVITRCPLRAWTLCVSQLPPNILQSSMSSSTSHNYSTLPPWEEPNRERLPWEGRILTSPWPWLMLGIQLQKILILPLTGNQVTRLLLKLIRPGSSPLDQFGLLTELLTHQEEVISILSSMRDSERNRSNWKKQTKRSLTFSTEGLRSCIMRNKISRRLTTWECLGTKATSQWAWSMTEGWLDSSASAPRESHSLEISPSTSGWSVDIISPIFEDFMN